MTHSFVAQDRTTLEFKPATHTVVIAGYKHCINNHFCNLADAQAYYDEQLAKVRSIYENMGKHITTERHNENRIIVEVKFQNVKKNGQVGKYSDLVRIATLDF